MKPMTLTRYFPGPRILRLVHKLLVGQHLGADMCRNGIRWPDKLLKTMHIALPDCCIVLKSSSAVMQQLGSFTTYQEMT